MSRLANIIDRTIYAVSPERGMRRINARRRKEFSDKIADITKLRLERKRSEFAAGGGFQSAENSSDAASWLTSELSPDSSLEEDRPTMIKRADSAYKNYELATAHVEGRVIRVAGCGMTIDPDIDADADEGDEEVIGEAEATRWNRKLRKNWDRAIESIGRHGESLWEIQHLMQRYWERRGEWFVLIGDKYDPLSPVTLKLEVIHPDRVETPPGKAGDKTVRMGIQLDASGCAVGCYVRDTHPGDTLDTTQTWSYYPYKQANGLPRMIHHFRRVDSGQHRGYPQFQVGTKRLKNAEEYDEAELERNYVGSCMAAFVRTDMPADDAMATHGVVEDSAGKRLRDIQPSMIHYVGPTDEVQFSNPNGAPATFDKFMEHEGRMFAAGAGSPYEMLTSDWRGLPYNGARIVWNQEDGAVDVLQLGHAKTIVWVYRHFLTRMIATGQVDINPVLYRDQPWLFWGCRVIKPARAALDPAREDRNDLVLIESCVKPHSDFVERKTGQPAAKVYKRIARNRQEMEDLDLEVHMPNMGRDEGGANSPTQPGDSNQESSDANSEAQAVGA